MSLDDRPFVSPAGDAYPPEIQSAALSILRSLPGCGDPNCRACPMNREKVQELLDAMTEPIQELRAAAGEVAAFFESFGSIHPSAGSDDVALFWHRQKFSPEIAKAYNIPEDRNVELTLGQIRRLHQACLQVPK